MTKMKKSLLFISLLLILCISLGAVSATDIKVNDMNNVDNMQNLEISQEDLSKNDVDNTLNLEISQEDLSKNDVDNTLNLEISQEDLSKNDAEVTNLQEGEGNITELEELINSASSGSIINLTKNYNLTRPSGIEGININKPLTIDGQGNTINSNLSYIFIINSDNVTIKNLKFVNSENNTCLGAIYWESGSNGSINSCSFINFNRIYNGGVIYWSGVNGSVSACNFINSSSSANGGSISWFGVGGNVSDCNFTNSHAGLGGAIYWSGVNGSVSACSFNNSTAGEGGAIFWAADNGSVSACSFNNSNSSSGAAIFWDPGYSNGIINRCNFTNSEAVGLGGAISLYFVNNCTVMNCNFINSTADENNGGAIFCSGSNCNIIACNFSNSKAGLDGGAIFWHEYAVNGSVSNCIFNNSNAANDGGAIYWNATDGSLSACNFFNSSAHGKYEGYGYGLGGAIFWGKYTPNSINDCNFTSSSARYGGSIYWANVDNGTVSDCNFFNSNAANDGGAIYWSGVNGTVSDCTFTKCNADSRDGGAIYWSAINGNINACDFTNCTTQSNKGGSIYITEDSQNTIVSSSNFTNSRACTHGGAISWLANNGVVINCNFINSSVGLSGGAIYWSGVNGTVSDSSFVNCSSVNDGGSIMISADLISGASLLIKYCNFTNSTTGNNGGTIIWGGSGNMIACNFINSSAKDGGTIHCTGVLGSINIADCNFTNSYARQHGGVIYWANDGTVSGCNFINCDVKYKGSAIYVNNEYSYLKLINSTCTPINETKAPIYNNGNIQSDLNITTLNGTDKNVCYGDNVNITATVTTSGIPIAGGTIELKVNNSHINATSNYEGVYSAFYTVDFVGTKHVNATYLNTRMQKVKPVQFVNVYNLISKFMSSFNVSVSDIVYGDIFIINITNATGVNDEKLSGIAKVIIDDKKYDVEVTRGSGYKVVDDILSCGNYTVNASLTVPNYDVMNSNTSFVVNKISTVVSVSVDDISYGDNATVSGAVSDVKGNVVDGNVDLFVNGTNVGTVSVEDGKFSTNLSDLGVGVYNITVVYNGDGNHLSSNSSTSLTVHGLNGSFDITVKDIVYGDGFIINITNATGVNGVLLNGTVDVSVNGKVYSFNVTDGEGSYKVSDILPAGKYVVNASLIVPNYDNIVNNTSFVVAKVPTKFIDATKGTVYNGKYYSVRLTDGSGKALASKNVAIKIAGKTYNVRTDKNGLAKVKLAITSKYLNKALTVTYKFGGDNTFKASSGSSEIKVIKTPTKLVNATKLVVKNHKNFYVKLTTKSGKVLANKVITMKSSVSGKTYKIKTNSKGIAKIDLWVKKQPLGKYYKYTFKYAGSSYYNSCTKTFKIKIIK